MDTKVVQLINHIQQEIQWVEELNALLIEEKDLLIHQNFEQLETYAQKKDELSSKLEQSASQRMDLVSNGKTEQSAKILLNEFLIQASKEEAEHINSLHAILVEQLTQCRELNTINGQVIANNIHTREQIVNTLSGNKKDAVRVYNAQGSVQSSTDTIHHQEA